MGLGARLLVATGAGLVHAWSIAWPFSWGVADLLKEGQPSGLLQVVSLACFFWLVLQTESSTPRRKAALRAAAISWTFGTAWLVGTVWWLFISMHTYGGLAAPMAAFAVLTLCALLSLYLALAVGIWRRFFAPNPLASAVKPISAAMSLIALASLWLVAELARARIFTGFPWGASGYGHTDSWLAAAAPLIGVYGIGFIAALTAAGLAALLLRPWHRGAVWALLGASSLVGIAHLAQPAVTRVEVLPAISVELLQGNVAQHEKFVRKGIQQALHWYSSRALASTAQLVIGPETAIPLLPEELPPDYLPQLREKFSSSTQSLLIGIPLVNPRGYTNSVIGMSAAHASSEKIYRYDKHHLVPFGEFIPPLFKWFVRMMNIPLGDFDRGALVQPAFESHGQRFLPNICYEDLFGEEMAANFSDVSRAPHVMVNFTNIGWFGNGIANDQHLHISRMRSLEFARPMVRATNTGTTAVIDHQGAVRAELERATVSTLITRVSGTQGKDQRVTPYALWAGRWGVWPLLAFASGMLLLAFTTQFIAKNIENESVGH